VLSKYRFAGDMDEQRPERSPSKYAVHPFH